MPKIELYHDIIVKLVKSIQRPDLLERACVYLVHLSHYEQVHAASASAGDPASKQRQSKENME